MNFPKEWELFEMYPNELSEIQINNYISGHEEASEHDRNGAFHWWLKKEPTEEELSKLMKLAYLDPDSHMGKDVRGYIRKAKNYNKKVESAWS